MDKILEIFEELKMEIRYINTKERLKVPYAIYHRLKDAKIFADNEIYCKGFNVNVEIYFSDLEKEREFEEKLERKLEENRFGFIKSEDITINEEVYLVNYEIGGIE